MNEEDALLALHLTPDLGPVRIRRIIEHFGNALAAVKLPAEVLQTVSGIGASGAYGLQRVLSEGVWEQEKAKLRALGAWILPYTDPRFPKSLRQLSNAPVLLEVLGTIEPGDRHALAVVGARDCTFYGTECAKRFAYQLAAARWTVVSGLARGIDTAAHLGALAAQGRTFAVLGSGLARIYPAENRGLAERIAGHGAVLSEFATEYPPSAQTFPYRNRVVAGLSAGLLLVEAGLQSGALITANLAADYGRQVFAIPGPIDRPTSAGANRLIQEGAKLVIDAEDILEEMGLLLPVGMHRNKDPEETAPAAGMQTTDPPNPVQRALLAALEQGEMNAESLVTRTGFSAPDVSGNLLDLELKHRVVCAPGNWYRLPGG
jgi:DNA processing protein